MANFLRGLAFPLELDGKGNLKVSEGVELIADHIVHKLLCQPGENPIRPSYGLPGTLFDSEQNYDEYLADVRRRLESEVPQAKFIVTGSFGDEGEALMNVEWTYEGLAQSNIVVELNR